MISGNDCICNGLGGVVIGFRAKAMNVTDAEKTNIKNSIGFRISVLKSDIEKIKVELGRILCLVDEMDLNNINLEKLSDKEIKLLVSLCLNELSNREHSKKYREKKKSLKLKVDGK